MTLKDNEAIALGAIKRLLALIKRAGIEQLAQPVARLGVTSSATAERRSEET